MADAFVYESESFLSKKTFFNTLAQVSTCESQLLQIERVLLLKVFSHTVSILASQKHATLLTGVVVNGYTVGLPFRML